MTKDPHTLIKKFILIKTFFSLKFLELKSLAVMSEFLFIILLTYWHTVLSVQLDNLYKRNYISCNP